MELDVCRNARANGLDLTFVATGGGDLEQDFRGSGVEFIRLNRRFSIDLGLVLQLRRIIKGRNIQVVHSHQPVEALHLYLATRGLTTKRILTLHGSYPGIKNELALRFVIPRMDALVVVSNDLLSSLGKARGIDAKRKFFVINNGVDPARLRSAGGKLRAELGLSDNVALLGMVANFYAGGQKDQLTVCKALPRLFESVPRARFVFVGGRSEAAPHLFDDCVSFCRQRKISDRVHFLGKRSDIPDLLASLDVFVLSSFREGSPIAAIEAMIMGIPTVLSDIGPLREVSGGGKYAALFRTRDPDDLAAKLIGLLEDGGYRARLGAEARQWAMSRFSIEMHIKSLVNLYDHTGA